MQTLKQLDGMTKALADVLRDYVDARLAPLEKKLATLEQQPAFKFCGAYVRANRYEKGSLVVHQSAWWWAAVDVDPIELPNISPKWILALKFVDERGGSK